MTTLELMGQKAKSASRVLLTAGALKNKALLAIADALTENTEEIVRENDIDIAAAKENGISASLIDRLKLSPERIAGMADGVRQVAALPDPIGTVISGGTTPGGLKIEKVRVPLGVIGIIYEARPNVTSDAAALCLKAGSAVILRGGKEAINSNKCVTAVMRKAIASVGLPEDCVALVEDTSRESSVELMRLSEYLDVLIPRGSAGLIKAVVNNSTVPVIETGAGNCHVYVDATADIDMAANIIFNAKTSRPSVCNAIETILVHKDIARDALPVIKARLDEKNVVLRCCPLSAEILGGVSEQNRVEPATEDDWYTEYGDYKLAVKIVDDIYEAIDHIAKYSTGHSESIVTRDYTSAQLFTDKVDSAAVYVNASTRFTDGGEFGLGAEIGISTQKLHARGPMGLNELTSMKFIIRGEGQVR